MGRRHIHTAVLKTGPTKTVQDTIKKTLEDMHTEIDTFDNEYYVRSKEILVFLPGTRVPIPYQLVYNFTNIISSLHKGGPRWQESRVDS